MATKQAGGTAIFRIDGTQYQLRGSVKIMTMEKDRKAFRGMDGSFGFTESYTPSKFECEVTDSGGLSIKAFENFTNEYVTFELGNGKTYGMTSAVATGAIDLDATEGKFQVTFEGLSQEITGS